MVPKRIQIKSPSQDKIFPQFPFFEKFKKYIFLAIFVLVLVVIFIASLALFMMSPSGSVSYPVELGRFSGTAQVYSKRDRNWNTVTRSSQRQIEVAPRYKIKTEDDSDLDFKIFDQVDFRLRAASELEVLPSRNPNELRLKIHKGNLLGMTKGSIHPDFNLQVETVTMKTSVKDNASFQIRTDGKKYTQASVLSGEMNVEVKKGKKKFPLKALETVTATKKDKKGSVKPKRVNYQEWREASEVRELIYVSPEQMAKQVDIRKKAGNMFKYIFDEGVFFKPNWGYAEREFYEQDGEVRLKVDYDVFPQNCFSGMYFKIRDLDLSKMKHLTMSVKAHPDKPIPNQFRIEFKDNLSTVRGFAVTGITRNWRQFSFDFHVTRSSAISEMTFVFENTRVGPLNMQGTVFIKDIQIE